MGHSTRRVGQSRMQQLSSVAPHSSPVSQTRLPHTGATVAGWTDATAMPGAVTLPMEASNCDATSPSSDSVPGVTVVVAVNAACSTPHTQANNHGG